MSSSDLVQKVAPLAPIPQWLSSRLIAQGRRRWVVTGCAGFIGCNIVENLLIANQDVVGIDNLSTGHLRNLQDIEKRVGQETWRRFEFHQIDINDATGVARALKGSDYVLHQAALGSVPRSIKDPMASFEANVRGFAVVLDASRQNGVKRFVYASSSSVYGDHPDLPKVEEKTGTVLSPYAATKASNELFAEVFANTYKMTAVGLRYFNVFGPRQDPDGAYAAVIPKWISALLSEHPPTINGDGETSRDFCFVGNAVQANILGAISDKLNHQHQVFNVAFQQRTSLNQLYQVLKEMVSKVKPSVLGLQAHYTDFRAGDVRHSLADTSKALAELGYVPEFDLTSGLQLAMPWYINDAARAQN
jgi:UDP-N-acetylglucosamine/UDP-N-acetylgalactosamine 4-epimerase